jgi:hypothetical protein
MIPVYVPAPRDVGAPVAPVVSIWAAHSARQPATPAGAAFTWLTRLGVTAADAAWLLTPTGRPAALTSGGPR